MGKFELSSSPTSKSSRAYLQVALCIDTSEQVIYDLVEKLRDQFAHMGVLMTETDRWYSYLFCRSSANVVLARCFMVSHYRVSI